MPSKQSVTGSTPVQRATLIFPARIIGQLDTNFKIGRRAALREIEDVKHDTREAEDVLDVAVAIAEADGEIEPEERKVLEEIAGVLGLRLENHL